MGTATFIIAGILTAVLIVLLFVRQAQKTRRRKLLFAIDRVKAATLGRLRHQYQKEFDDYFARQLAGTIATEIFSEEDVGKTEAVFRKHNATLIESKLQQLQFDVELRKMVSQAVLVENRLKPSRATAPEGQPPANVRRLEELCLMVPGNAAPPPDQFLAKVKEYYDQNVDPAL